MPISEELAAGFAAVGVGLGYAVKFVLARVRPAGSDDEVERRRGSAAVLRSMREEIERLKDVVAELSDLVDSEIGKRRALENENSRLMDRVRHLESEVTRLGGNT
jgi:hypothetical protein